MSRIVLRISLGMLFVLVTSLFIVHWGVVQASRSRIRKHIISHVKTVARAHQRLENAPPGKLQAVLASLKRESKHPIRLLDPARDEIPADVLRAWRHHEPRVTFDRHSIYTVWIPVRKNKLLLAVGVHTVHWDPIPLAKMVVAIFFVVLVTGVTLAWPMVRRIRSLGRVADRIATGDLSARATFSSKDALGRLGLRFNAMAEQVELLLQRQQRLIQGVSHELRTPAARIRFGLEMLRTAKGEEDRERRLQSIDEDLDELDNLVGDLLLYIKSGDQALQPQSQEIDVLTELRILLEKQAELRPEITCDLRPAPALEPSPTGRGITLRADRRHFRRAMRNLLENAIRHARTRVLIQVHDLGQGDLCPARGGRSPGELPANPPHQSEMPPGDDARAAHRGHGKSTADPEGDDLLILVIDDGPGVAPRDRERIFEPFARQDASRSRQSGGAGLGLAIVRRILRAHQGDVWVEAAEDGGARFVTRWPGARPHG